MDAGRLSTDGLDALTFEAQQFRRFHTDGFENCRGVLIEGFDKADIVESTKIPLRHCEQFVRLEIVNKHQLRHIAADRKLPDLMVPERAPVRFDGCGLQESLEIIAPRQIVYRYVVGVPRRAKGIQ